MAGEIRTSVLINLAGNLSTRARQFQQSLHNFSTGGSRSMAVLRNAARAGAGALDMLGNRYTALLTGVAGVGAVRSLITLDERLTRIGIKSNTAAAGMKELKQEVFALSNEKDIRIGPDQLLEAMDEILEASGDMEFATKNMRNMALAISATGASGKDIGKLFAEFRNIRITDPAEVLKVFDVMNIQGERGAFTLEKMAALGPRVINAYTKTGRTGAQALREMGAALQVIMKGTGDPERAATAFEALIRTLTDPEKVKILSGAGIQLFDPKKLKEGERTLRPITELMVEIVDKAKGDIVKLGSVFGDEAMRALSSIITERRAKGTITSLKELEKVTGDGTKTTNDSARAASTAAAAWRSLGTEWMRFADANLSGPIQSVADALNSLDQETISNWFKAAAGVGGLVAAWKLFRGGQRVVGMFRGGGAAGGAGGLGGGARGMAPVPVWVVNSGALGGAAGGAAGGVLKGGPMGFLGKAGLVGAAGAAGYGVGTLANMAWSAVLTKMLGRETSIGTGLYELFNQKTEAKLAGELNIRIDSEGRARVQSMKTNQRELELSVDTGAMMVSP